MFFIKEKLKEIGKAGGEFAKDYVKEESKSFLSDLIQGFLIKLALSLIIGGFCIYFLFSLYFYSLKKVEEVKVATTEYVSEKTENINNSINNLKTNVEDITNKTIDSIEVKKDSLLNKIDSVKENVINSIENKTESTTVETQPVIETKSALETQPVIEKESKFNIFNSKVKDSISNTKEKLIEIKEELIEIKEELKPENK